MTHEELKALLKGQVIKSVDRSTGQVTESELERDALSEDVSSGITIWFESGLVLHLEARVWDYGDQWGLAVTFKD